MSDDFFPSVERVEYAKAPLVQVIAQFNFPTLLRIQGSPPAEFQEQIRGQFPILDLTAGILIPNLPQEFVQLLGGTSAGGQYSFKSTDGTDSVSLTPQSLTFATSNYGRWEGFRTRFDEALNALISIYKPSFFSRIGLRYSNAIDKLALNLDSPWSELISKNIIGELGNPEIEAGVVDARRFLQIRLPNGGGFLLLQHGLNVLPQRPGAYAVDFDFFTDERTETKDAGDVLEKFHGRAARAFRWSITGKLHDLLGPKPMEPAGSDDQGFGT